MIRQFTSDDEPRLAAFCGRAPEQNIVMLANLAELGGHGGLVQFWGEVDAAGNLAAVLMRYGTLWYLDAPPGADLLELAGLISRVGQERLVLNGPPETISVLAPLIAEYAAELRLPARLRILRENAALTRRTGSPAVRRATLDDVPALAELYAAAPQDVRRGADSLRRSVAGARRAYLAERGRAVTACALTTAELPGLALAGGLHGEGRMWDADLTAALGALCESLQQDGKTVTAVTRDLWTDRICDALGFADAAPWLIIHMKR
ncbi:MAG TPA: hypothetical protein VD969_11555 [Symbiobacteriaceae bacterium]|nr:hypothetical protein [Symbiobacteriaceae bacterium]